LLRFARNDRIYQLHLDEVLVGIDQHPVSLTLGAHADDNSFVKESDHSFIPLHPLTLSDVKVFAPACAHRCLFSQRLSVVSCEAKDTGFVPTDGALAEYPPFKVALARTGMVLDGQPKRNHPTDLALVQSKEVVVVRVAVRLDTVPGERL
jgi:hypothetical protein